MTDQIKRQEDEAITNINKATQASLKSISDAQSQAFKNILGYKTEQLEEFRRLDHAQFESVDQLVSTRVNELVNPLLSDVIGFLQKTNDDLAEKAKKYKRIENIMNTIIMIILTVFCVLFASAILLSPRA